MAAHGDVEEINVKLNHGVVSRLPVLFPRDCLGAGQIPAIFNAHEILKRAKAVAESARPDLPKLSFKAQMSAKAAVSTADSYA